MKGILKNSIIVSIVFFICILIFSVIFGYQSAMDFLIRGIGESKNKEAVLRHIPEGKFLFFQIGVALIIFIQLIALKFLNKVVVFFNSSYIYVKRNIQIVLVELWKDKVKWILIIPSFSSILFAIQLPVSYDEAWTYLQFTSKSPLVSLCYYPAPNNHVLHSLITNFTRYVPFLSVLLCLRISSIVVSLVTWLNCYSFFKKYYSENVSIVITGIASMLFMSIYYSYMSRGYALLVLFFILALRASFNIIFEGGKRKDWLLFSITNFFGFFVMPSYLYPFIMLNILILWNSRLQLKKQFIFNVCTVIFVMLAYTPIVIYNGLTALISNRFVQPISRGEVLDRLPMYFSTTLNEITGIHVLITCVLLLVSFFIILKNKMKFEWCLFMIFICAPFFLLMLHSVIPFPRTFNYYAVVLICLIVIPFSEQIKKIPATYLLSGVLTIQILLFFNFTALIYKYESFNVSFHEINKRIIGNNSYYFSASLIETNFSYEMKSHGYKAKRLYSEYSPVQVNVDTLVGYDFYIIDKKVDCTKATRPYYSDTLMNVYRK